MSDTDVLTISITRSRAEKLRKDIAELLSSEEASGKYDEALGDVLYYLNTAVLTAPSTKNAPYPDVNDEKPHFMPVEEMVK